MNKIKMKVEKDALRLNASNAEKYALTVLGEIYYLYNLVKLGLNISNEKYFVAR